MSKSQQPQDGAVQNINLTRRQMMQSTAAAAGAGAVGLTAHEYGLSPVGTSRAIPPAVLFVAGGASIGWGVANILNGDGSNVSEDEVQNARAEELHSRIFEDMLEIKQTEEQHFKTFNEIPRLVRDHIRLNAGARVEQAVIDGLSKSETISVVEDEIKTTVAGFEQQHISAWNSLALQTGRNVEAIKQNGQLDVESIFSGSASYDIDGTTDNYSENHAHFFAEVYDNSDDTDNNGIAGNSIESEVTLRDGSTQIVYDASLYDGSVYYKWGPRGGSGLAMSMSPPDNASSSSQEMLNAQRWQDVWDDLQTIGEEEVNQAAALTELLYEPLKNGDIASAEFASASDLREQAQNADNYNEAAALQRSMNLAEASTPVMIETPLRKIECLLFSSVDDRTLPVGETIDPESMSGVLEMSGEVKAVDPEYGPREPFPIDVQISVTRTDTTDPAALGTVEVTNGSLYSDHDEFTTSTTLDENGKATLTLDGRFDKTEITINHDGDTYVTTLDHGGSDTQLPVDFDPNAAGTGSAPNDRQFRDAGDIIQGQLSGEFVIVDAFDGSSEITFERRALIDPQSGDTEDIREALEAAYDDTERSNQNVSDLIDKIDENNNGGLFSGGGNGFPTIPGTGVFGTIAAIVVGIMTINAATD